VNRIAKAGFASALAGLALFTVAARPAEAANFTGTWSISGTMAHGNVGAKVSPVCTLRQSGNALSGTCRGPNGAGAATGTVNGSRVLWQWHVTATNSIGMSGVMTFHGTLGADNVVRGTWTASPIPGGVGEFTQIRA
jgi:hypothetical protein